MTDEGQNIPAQELYERFLEESVRRAQITGQRIPTEVEVFSVLVKEVRKLVARGQAEPEALDELREVKAIKVQEVIEILKEKKALAEKKEKSLIFIP